MARSIAVWVSDANKSEKDDVKTKGTVPIKQPGWGPKELDPGVSEPSKSEIELHFNLWTLSSKKQNRKHKKEKSGRWLFPLNIFSSLSNASRRIFKRCVLFMKEVEPICFLDIGVKFKGVEQRDLFIYFPFHIARDDYDGELGNLISNDVNLISTIFNDEVKGVSFKDNLYHFSDIEFAGGESSKIRFFTRLELSETNALGPGVQLSPVGQEGCFLRFPVSTFQSPSGGHGYFRFRIILNGACQKAICTSYKPKDRFLLTSEEHVDMIDFRVNEIRNLPDNINKHLSNKHLSGTFLLNKVHFLVIREIESEYVMANTDYDRCRLLEGDVWKKYLQTNKLHSIQEIPKMLVFHWKSNSKRDSSGSFSVATPSGISEFAAFAKFRYRRQSWLIICRSILIALILSIVANFLSGYIENVLKFRHDTEVVTVSGSTSTAVKLVVR